MALFDHETCMDRCLKLASLGLGHVINGPLSGVLIVFDDQIIGEAYSNTDPTISPIEKALSLVNDDNRDLISHSHLYLNIVPHADYDINLIIKSKFKKVIIAYVDAKVDQLIIKQLKSTNIGVIENLAPKQAQFLNRRFFSFSNKKRPYIILKWAQSIDGFMDIDRQNNETGIFWITQPETKALVHKWRHQEDAILIGRKTVENDNPSLTCRSYSGNSPIRVILDFSLKLDHLNYAIGNDVFPTLILNLHKSQCDGKLTYIKLSDPSIQSVLKALYEHQIQSVIIEGGKATLTHFIKENIWDEARILTGVSKLLKGVSAPKLNHTITDTYYFGKDKIDLIYQ